MLLETLWLYDALRGFKHYKNEKRLQASSLLAYQDPASQTIKLQLAAQVPCPIDVSLLTRLQT